MKKETQRLINRLLRDAYKCEITIDQMFDYFCDEALRLGEIDSELLELKIREIQENYSMLLDMVTERVDQVMGKSLMQTYQNTVIRTKELTDIMKGIKHTPPKVVITDTYIKSNVLPIPWLDGKNYSERLYSNVANFKSKLDFVLREGITNGKGKEWMEKSWKKLTKQNAYNTSRLLRTETMAMWSRATKETYLSEGIDYVEIVGDASCGSICSDYVGMVIPLAEAELGDDLPPYHPNCLCSYTAAKSEDKTDLSS